MQKKMFYCLFIFLSFVVIVSCGGDSNSDGGDKNCFSSEVKKLNGKCSSIEVKASPNDALDDRMLKVYYSILPSIDKSSTKEPIAILVGGPGPSNTIETDRYVANLPSFLRERDIIIMDYRGTGFSEPYPRCDNLFTENGLDVSLFEICVQGFKDKGIKLGDYTSANIAYDFNKILEKEKIEKVVLLGYSYGTRVATTIARDYPNKVSSMMLDGFFTIESNGISQAKESILDKFNDLALKYDVKYPTAKLRNKLEEIAVGLDPSEYYLFLFYLKGISSIAYTSDAVVQTKTILDTLSSTLGNIKDLAIKYDKEYPTNNLKYELKKIAMKLDPSAYYLFLFDLNKISALVDTSDAVVKIKEALSPANRSIDPKFYYRSGSHIMALGVIMYEEASFMSKQPSFNFGFDDTTAKSLQSFQGGAPLDISSIDKIKPHFTKVPVGDKEITALSTDIPTIIFTGGLDYQTTKYWALNAQKTLKNSMHFFFPADGHVLTLTNPKSHILMNNFLNNDNFLDSDGNLSGYGYSQIRP